MQESLELFYFKNEHTEIFPIEEMLDRVNIDSASNELGCSRRTFRKWCLRNDVHILRDHGSRMQYVIKAEYRAAKFRESLKYLSKKYKAGIPLEIKQHLNKIIGFKDTTINKGQIYIPQGENEKRFLSILSKSKSR